GPMPSPTFNLVYHYHGARGVDVWHLDLYRLEDPDDVWELGWRELGAGDDIVLIEWPERAESLLPRDRWDIFLDMGPESEARWVRAVRCGDAPALPAPEGVARGTGARARSRISRSTRRRRSGAWRWGEGASASPR